MAIVSIRNLNKSFPVENINGKTIRNLYEEKDLDSFYLPIVVKFNGEWLFRKDWDVVLQENDILEFQILPQGGGSSKQITAAVIMIVVMIFAPEFAPQMAATLGVSEATATAIIYVGASLAVSTLIRPPMPKLAGINFGEQDSPTYSIQAQGNTARIGNTVPIVYGKHMIYPDYAALPYSYYENNDEYLNQLFVIGMGEYEIDATKIRIEDTSVNNFEEITYEIVKPGQSINLFNHNCVSCSEISGQTLKHDKYVGGFTLNKADSIINKIEVNLVAPRGIYYAANVGLDPRSVTAIIEARKIDEEANPIGEWVEVLREVITDASNSPVRRTYSVDVEPSRYEVRAKRTVAESTSTREATTLSLAGLKGFLNHDITYDGMTLIAMKMKATDNLSQQTSRKVNLTVTRKLPIWNSQTGWSEPVPTNSIAWALADLCRASYAGNLVDEKINLEQLEYLDKVYTANGDEFNAVFDSKLKLLEALDRVGKASRTLPYVQAGKVYFVRDEYDTPGMMFCTRNIIKDSWNTDYIMPTSETIDYAEVTYFDNKTWTNKTFDVSLDNGPMTKKTQMTMFGVTNKAQAIREAKYFLKANKYRRRILKFDTEMEGAIPGIGSVIKVSYPIPSWAKDGFVMFYDSETNVLDLSESLEMQEGVDYYICLRNLSGEAQEPIKVIRESLMLPNQLKLLDNPTCEIYTGNKKEKTYFQFGTLKEVLKHAKVNSIVPKDEHTVTIVSTIDDSRVYEETPTQGVV